MAIVEMKNLKFAVAAALSLALLGCGRNVKFSSKSGAASQVQTANGTLQISNVSLQFIGDQFSSDYQVSATITQAGRSVNLVTYMTLQSSGSPTSQSANGNTYSLSAACASDSCDEFIGLYNYSGSAAGIGQFAVLYKVASDGSVSKESEADGTSFSNPGDAIYTLRRMIE